ncbi:glycoside hydrolase family 115 protein [Patellaria atrata CBS 101060]|uniref:Glycoside hydrolase family 115 protein n=1 Tax=Patellaria atrata CBS 101060 TaxID=1346257 RepID=A0A9P4SFQ5_9PEZI|nr:glycoside hydrolase family 115 protein [Patellaria atrata CBS 101060]
MRALNSFSSLFLSVLLLLLPSVLAIGQNATIGFEAGNNSTLKLASHGSAVQIHVSKGDDPSVLRASNDLAKDFGRVTGTNGAVHLMDSGNSTVGNASAIFNVTGITTFEMSSNGTVGGHILAGTIGKSKMIDDLVAAGKIDVSNTKGQWEAFVSTVVSNPMPGVSQALVIAGKISSINNYGIYDANRTIGADRRGTIYGLYDISEQIGVSPWYWFADVPAKQHSEIYAIGETKVQASPSVKYRGFFINDEAPALTGWMNSKYPRNQWGSSYYADFYQHVFELLLRLRANYLWPAMWGEMFGVDDPRNQPLAHEFGIVMGTSHTEPMMCATNEWGNFHTSEYQWKTNNATLYEYFEQCAARARPYEGVLTMGMRGVGDTAMSADIEVENLQNVVNAQRDILADLYGEQNVNDVPQMWCLYKEVQEYYEDGFEVPDDITLLWTDDNWGNLRRLPVGSEVERSGGAGVYYHFDYVGDPRNYKWINTIQLEKTWEQMSMAYERHARDIWIVNVGDIKPLELPISHFFDLAYDITAYDLNSTVSWTAAWAAREFGSEHASAIADVLTTYGQLSARRKYELLDPSTYSVINYEEAERVLSEWSSLLNATEMINSALDSAHQPAFFEMVLHPVRAGKAVHDVHIHAAYNKLYAQQGRTSTNIAAQNVLDAFEEDRKLSEEYNTMLNGRWAHMMDQTHIGYAHWQQTMRQTTPPLYYVQALERGLNGDMGIGVEASNATVPGDDPWHGNGQNWLELQPMDPFGKKTYIDIYSTGTQAFTYTISAEPHVKLTSYTGRIDPRGGLEDMQTRIYVDVDWASAPAGGSRSRLNVTSSTDYGAQFNAPWLFLPINNTVVPDDFHGFVESRGHIAIEAAHYTSLSGASDELTYIEIPHYGRTLSGVKLSDNLAASQSPDSGSPALEYSIYTFTNTSSSKPANVTLHLGTPINTIRERPLKYAVQVDEAEPKVVQYVVDQKFKQDSNLNPVGWYKAVADAAWYSTTNFTMSAGAHTLRVWALEPGVVFQKVVVDLGGMAGGAGGVKGSYLGPPESEMV